MDSKYVASGIISADAALSMHARSCEVGAVGGGCNWEGESVVGMMLAV
jgi:hypothetical protein